MTGDKKSAEERFTRDLLRENSALQKKLGELSDLISERETAEFTDMEVRHGTVVFLGCK